MKKKEPKTRVVQVRVTEKEFHRAKLLADLYANGNMSRWAVHGMLTGERKHLK